MSGLSRTPGKRVRVNSPPRVRIPPSPPGPPFPRPAGLGKRAMRRPIAAVGQVPVSTLAMRLPPPSPWAVAEYRFRWLMVGFVLGLIATLSIA